ncbi:hypothetical protein BC332_15460 [Capsicum chinense]|nr:hypothetical protein BC332_15460 [Capsicum chinense]
MFLGSNSISWCPKKQSITCKSSIEVEYSVVAYTVAENTWIGHILCELNLYLDELVCLFCDYVSSTYMSSNAVFHDRLKHIDVDFHYVHDKVTHGDLVVQYVPTCSQYADISTKGLLSSQFCLLHNNLNVISFSPD